MFDHSKINHLRPIPKDSRKRDQGSGSKGSVQFFFDRFDRTTRDKDCLFSSPAGPCLWHDAPRGLEARHDLGMLR